MQGTEFGSVNEKTGREGFPEKAEPLQNEVK